MDSGFFSAGNHLIEKGWVFCDGDDLKRRYWPNNVGVEAVKDHFSGKELGYDDAIYGLIDGQHFHIRVTK